MALLWNFVWTFCSHVCGARDIRCQKQTNQSVLWKKASYFRLMWYHWQQRNNWLWISPLWICKTKHHSDFVGKITGTLTGLKLWIHFPSCPMVVRIAYRSSHNVVWKCGIDKMRTTGWQSDRKRKHCYNNSILDAGIGILSQYCR